MKIVPCAKRWNFPCVDLSTRMIRTCCRAYGPIATREDVRNLGKNVFLNHPYMKKGRELMLKGEYQFDCRTCYETSGDGDGFQTSYTDTVKQLAPTYRESEAELDINLRKTPYDAKYLTSHSAIELEVSFGNACDLMCVYCSSAYSSQIEAEDKRFNEPPSQFVQTAIEKNEDLLEAFWQWIDEDALKDIGNIHLIGGETLFNDYLYTFLDKLDACYRKNNLTHVIFINVFSNLNNTSAVKRFSDTILRIHPNFRVKLLFSNESTGKRAEFIRHGMNWERTLGNVKRVLEVGRIDLGFAPSFNSLSMSTAREFLGLVYELHQLSGKKFYCGDNYIPFPYSFNPFILTKEFLPYAEEAIKFLDEKGNEFLLEESIVRLRKFFETFRRMVLSNSDTNVALKQKRIDFARKIRSLQERRNVDFAEAFPEYEEFCSLCEGLDY